MRACEAARCVDRLGFVQGRERACPPVDQLRVLPRSPARSFGFLRSLRRASARSSALRCRWRSPLQHQLARLVEHAQHLGRRAHAVELGVGLLLEQRLERLAREVVAAERDTAPCRARGGSSRPGCRSDRRRRSGGWPAPPRRRSGRARTCSRSTGSCSSIAACFLRTSPPSMRRAELRLGELLALRADSTRSASGTSRIWPRTTRALDVSLKRRMVFMPAYES